jgi:hypothetical protein
LARFAKPFSSFWDCGLRPFSSVPPVAQRFCEKDRKWEKDTECSLPRAASADQEIQKESPSIFQRDMPFVAR